MRGQTLNVLLDNLRAEIGHSTNVAHGLNAEEALKRHLRRVQDALWAQWDWPHLAVYREINLVKGQRYYALPQDLPFERIYFDEALIRHGDSWYRMIYGIDPTELFREYDSDRGDEGWPTRRWEVSEDPQDTAGLIDNIGTIEVWPIPSEAGRMKVKGIRAMRQLVNGSDRCEIDGDLIVMFAAAELLARQKAPDAEAKAGTAQRMFQSIKSKGSKHKVFGMGIQQPSLSQFYPRGMPLPPVK